MTVTCNQLGEGRIIAVVFLGRLREGYFCLIFADDST
jgi:hypothetical protein